MIAGAGWKPGNGQKIARCGLMADISRTITAGTPRDVRYIQYNTYYIEYLTRNPAQQREARKRSSGISAAAAGTRGLVYERQGPSWVLVE